MIPDRIYDILDHFSAEAEKEAIRTIRDYARHWDIHRTGDGFDVSHLSVQASAAFFAVYKEIQGYNRDYFERAYANSNNAVSGWEKRKDNEERNRKRREAYAAKRVAEKEAASRVDFDMDTRGKPEYDRKKEPECDRSFGDKRHLGDWRDKEPVGPFKSYSDVDKSEKSSTFRSDETAKNASFGDTKTDTKVASASISSKASSGNMRSHTGLLLTVTNSNELITEVVVTKEKGCGEKHFIHKDCVDNSDCSYPSASLTGSKPLPASPEDGEESKAVKGKSKPAARTGSKAVMKSKPLARTGSKGSQGSQVSDCQNKSDNQGRRQASSNDLRNKNSANSKSHGKRGVCRGWVHKDKSLVVDETFKIDFLDPVFTPFNRADEFLIKGFEDWVRRELVGRRAEKKWLARKFWLFACNQEKMDYFLKIWSESV